MSLRARLFLIFATLAIFLAAANLLLVRSLTSQMGDEVDRLAVQIGKSVATIWSEHAPPTETQVKVFQLRDGKLEERPLTDEQVMNDEFLARPGTIVRRVITERRSESGDKAHAFHFEHRFNVDVKEGDDARVLMFPGPTGLHEVPIPRFGMVDRLAEFERKIVLGTLVLLVAALLAAFYLAHRIAVPLQALIGGTQALGLGHYGTQVSEASADREIRGALGAFNAMSARLAELDAQNRELAEQRHLGEIGELARGLAHTLRNPLNALGLSVDELAGRGNDPETSALLAAARRQIGRLDHGIRSFLVLASQAGAPTRLDLGEVAQDVALEALQDAQGRVRIEVELAAGADLTLDGVEAELRAMIQALVVNAVEASPPGALVKVRVERAGARLRLEVLDQGPGLAPEVRARLFTPHVTTKANGSGMGLFLSQRLAIHRYQGGVELLERAEGGLCARLVLGDRVGERSGMSKLV